jgi:hypothetical protein
LPWQIRESDDVLERELVDACLLRGDVDGGHRARASGAEGGDRERSWTTGVRKARSRNCRVRSSEHRLLSHREGLRCS